MRIRPLSIRLAEVSLLTVLSLATLAVAARTGLAPRDPAKGAAVIFSPWTPPEAALSRAVEAGGRFVRFGALPFITIVMPDDADYASRMLHAGAWLVVDPQALAACLPGFADPDGKG